MHDNISAEKRSRIMASIKSKNTRPEINIFKELRKKKICFQKHYKRIKEKPDIAFPTKKIAIFIDGDFWHGYRYPCWSGRLSSKFWKNKIEHNRQRDKYNFVYLKNKGWKVLRIWEHEINNDLNKSVSKILKFIF